MIVNDSVKEGGNTSIPSRYEICNDDERVQKKTVLLINQKSA